MVDPGSSSLQAPWGMVTSRGAPLPWSPSPSSPPWLCGEKVECGEGGREEGGREEGGREGGEEGV